MAAFGTDEEEAFTDDDWEHAIGGLHFVCDLDGEVVAHASVVERELHVGGRALRTGYVEAVATAPDRQGAGFGSLVMAEANAYIRDAFELGGLGTGRQAFYERLGWRTWTGPSAVRTAEGVRPTPDDDGYIMVLTTPDVAAARPERDHHVRVAPRRRLVGRHHPDGVATGRLGVPVRTRTT